MLLKIQRIGIKLYTPRGDGYFEFNYFVVISQHKNVKLYTPRGDGYFLSFRVFKKMLEEKYGYILREETETKKAEINYVLKLKMSIIRHFFYLHKL